MPNPEKAFKEWMEKEGNLGFSRLVKKYMGEAFHAGRASASEGRDRICDPDCRSCYPVISAEPHYSHMSHSHCWNQKQPPACGIPLEEHTQCCLCDTKVPEFNGSDVKLVKPIENENWEAEFDKKFLNIILPRFGTDIHMAGDEVKGFIRSLLHTQREADIEKLKTLAQKPCGGYCGMLEECMEPFHGRKDKFAEALESLYQDKNQP